MACGTFGAICAVRPIPAEAGALREERDHRVRYLGGTDRHPFEVELAGLNLGEVENIVDDCQQRFAGPRNDIRIAALAWRQV